MPLLGRRRDADGDGHRPRELVIADEPVVTADSSVVLVDLTVRWDQVPREDGPVLPWAAADESAIRAVAVTSLRVEGAAVDRDDVLAERTRLADPLGRALELAPVVPGFRATVVSLEVRAHDPAMTPTWSFRVAG